MIFTKGFEINGMLYGWHRKELYRLPSEIGLRYYPLRQLPVIKIGNKSGYRFKQKKQTFEQCLSRTRQLIKPVIVEQFIDEKTPF